MSQVKRIVIGSSLILLSISFLLINRPWERSIASVVSVSETREEENQSKNLGTISLLSKIDTRDGVTFEVTPLDFSFDNVVRFEVKIDTHSGSLDFDMDKISILKDDKGNQYEALEWQGSPSGGHHRSGVLLFAKLDISTEILKLFIGDVPPRIFEWSLE